MAELYDIEFDPDERRNLIDNPQVRRRRATAAGGTRSPDAAKPV